MEYTSTHRRQVSQDVQSGRVNWHRRKQKRREEKKEEEEEEERDWLCGRAVSVPGEGNAAELCRSPDQELWRAELLLVRCAPRALLETTTGRHASLGVAEKELPSSPELTGHAKILLPLSSHVLLPLTFCH